MNKRAKLFVWVSIGTDGHPIGVSWYRDHLQSNAKRVRMELVPVLVKEILVKKRGKK